jgi:hypothetical protein
VTDVVRPLLSRSTTVPLARVIFEDPPFALLGRPLSEAFFSSVLAVLSGRPPGLFDEPRLPGLLVVEPGSSAVSVEEPGRAGALLEEPRRPGRLIAGALSSAASVEDPVRPGALVEEPRRPGPFVDDPRLSEASVEEPERPGALVEEPGPPGRLIDGAFSSAVSVEDPVRPGALVAGLRRPGPLVDEPRSPAVSGEDPERPGALVEGLCWPALPELGLFLSSGFAGRWLVIGREFPWAFGAEAESDECSDEEFSSCCADTCGATNSKRKKNGSKRAAKVKVVRSEFMMSPIGFNRLAEPLFFDRENPFQSLVIIDTHLRHSKDCNPAAKPKR